VLSGEILSNPMKPLMFLRLFAVAGSVGESVGTCYCSQILRLVPTPANQIAAVTARREGEDISAELANEERCKLHCSGHGMEGLATCEGLWIKTSDRRVGDGKVRVIATAMTREPWLGGFPSGDVRGSLSQSDPARAQTCM
jgi:hypothetical protein